MFSKITVEGFRGINNLEIEDFKQFNLFVGKNNCGKTTILEALYLITEPTNPRISIKINSLREIDTRNRNSWRLFYNKLDIDSSIKIYGELRDADERRTLVIEHLAKHNMSSNAEWATQCLTDNYGIHEDSLLYSQEVTGLVLKYINSKHNKQEDVVIRLISKPDGKLEVDLSEKLGKYHEWLKGTFINLKTTFNNDKEVSKRFDRVQIEKQTDKIIKILQRIEPSLVNLSLGVDDVIHCDVKLPRMMPINVMGDGIVRLLSIILAIYDTRNGIIFIDEIENGFHHSSQEILWDVIFEAAREFNVQVFATTHSWECVSAYISSRSHYKDSDSLRLFRVERKDGNFRVESYDEEILKASVENNIEVR